MSKSRLKMLEGGGTEVTRFNALRHGLLSRYTVLPWEDGDEYHGLLDALVAEHQPSGPTEEHLVEELAGIVWRKRRLRLAEAATHRHGLAKTLGTHRDTAKAALVHVDGSDHERIVDAIRATAADTDEERADLAADEATTRRALDILDGSSGDLYAAALAELRDDTQEWWAETLACVSEEMEDGKEPATADVSGLRRFIESEVLPWFEARERDLSHRHLIREQAFGEAVDPDKLERLGRYEVHLDRKFERTLAMLLKLKELRRPTVTV
jgi:hypothetical protein